MALSGMLGDVTQTRVRGLLEERDPRILDESIPDEVARFEARVQGAAVEVVALIGTDPAAGPLRSLAVEAITRQTASEIEYAEYPEQQNAGNIGRGYSLHQRYLELLARIQAIVTATGIPNGDGTLTPSATAPSGSFPPADPYPDVVLGDPELDAWRGRRGLTYGWPL